MSSAGEARIFWNITPIPQPVPHLLIVPLAIATELVLSACAYICKKKKKYCSYSTEDLCALF
jgi:hypothetical protein